VVFVVFVYEYILDGGLVSFFFFLFGLGLEKWACLGALFVSFCHFDSFLFSISIFFD
jgi:hypothetical protein